MRWIEVTSRVALEMAIPKDEVRTQCGVDSMNVVVEWIVGTRWMITGIDLSIASWCFLPFVVRCLVEAAFWMNEKHACTRKAKP